MGPANAPAWQSKSAPIESRQRLSASLLWKLQRRFFDTQGVDAWARAGIPLHITSNTFIARAYARLIVGFLSAWQSDLDLDSPLYIVELGAGHGRFGFLLLTRLLEELTAAGLDGVGIRYVLTDLSARNIEHWQSAPRLRRFFESGALDVAVFDVENIDSIRLLRSGVALVKDTLRNPLVAISNYLFDSIPQDAFLVQDGQLYENLISLSSSRAEPDLTAPDLLSRVEVSYFPQPARDAYYEDADWNRLLADSARRLPSVPFLFPIAALRCVQALEELSGNRLLLISADKGYHSEEAILQGQGAPGMVRHSDGCFSMMVDYRVLGAFVESRGGAALHPGHFHESLNISAFLSRQPASILQQTRRAYETAIEEFGPDDFFTLINGIAPLVATMSIEQSLAYLRLSAWDFRLAWTFLPLWKQHVEDATPAQRREIRTAALNVWAAYFPLPQEDDLAFQLGVLLLELGFYPDALEFLERSEQLYGMEAGTAYNIGVCHYQMLDKTCALESVDRALALNPGFDAARALRIRINSAP
jgi:tetratricopeptide (TPR) repeat protein